MSVIRKIQNEQTLAAGLLASIRETVRDDDEAIHDAVEGETNLFEAIDAGLERLSEIDGLLVGLSKVMEKMKLREGRFKRQQEAIRTAICVAMEAAVIKKVERPTATVTRKAVAPTAIITDETLLPADYFSIPKTPDPKPDKRLILAALKDGEDVPGAELSNGSETIQIKRT